MAERSSIPRRVALVIGQLTIGGAERQLCELVRRLDRSRFAPIVYDLADAGSALSSTIALAGVPVRTIGGVGLERVRRLAAALASDRIDLVHAWLFIANTYAWAARWSGRRVPLVTSARNCKSQGWVHHLANIAAFRSSARIIVNSMEVREYIARHYHAMRTRIDVVYNGVDTQRFRPAAETPSGPPTVVTVGRIVAQKNPLLFIEAAARVRRLIPHMRFAIVGDGPLREAVQERARQLGLDGSLDLLGERDDVERILPRAAMFWLTSSWEGLPNAVMEAMACGLPVVATDVGGTRELFASGEEGFLVRPNAVEDFVHYGLTIMRGEQLRAAMGQAARRRAEQFSLERMVAGTEAVYAAALGDGA